MNKNKKNGFSIVEMIVYLSIFMFMSIVVLKSFIVTLSSFNNTRINRELVESSSTVMERISREIRKTKTVNVVNSTLGTSPGILQLDSLNVSGQADSVIRFTVSSGALNIYENGTLIGNLLGQKTTVTNLVFRRIVTTNSEAIKVELTLQVTVGGKTRTENFYDTIISRGGY